MRIPPLSAPGPWLPEYLASIKSLSLYRQLWPLLAPYRASLWLVLVATAARPLLNLAKVWLLKVLIDQVLQSGAAARNAILLWICAGYLGIALAKGCATCVDGYLGGWIGAQVVRDLRILLYDRLQGLSLRFYHRQRLGDLLTRLTGDISAIEDLLIAGSTDLVVHCLTIALFLGILFYLDRSLALVALLVLPALATLTLVTARRGRSIQQTIRERLSALTSTAEEGLSAIALVKAFAREPFERDRFGQAAAASCNARRRAIRLGAVSTPLIELIATIGTVLVVWFGTQAVLSGRLSVGGLVVFLGYLGSLYTPIQALSRLAGTFQRARVGAERVLEVLAAGAEDQERRVDARLPALRGAVEFRDVTFGYRPGQAILRGFNLAIRPGEVVALVGASGAGKTTAVSLLLAYYDPDAGSVTIAGQDLRRFDPPSIRCRITAVLQEPMLFQTSVRENLRYGCLDATDAEIEDAATLAAADGFIRELPDGYETPVGPRGARLSGGQRQRLALARACLKDAPVVILDEATAALDPATEAEVLRRLRRRWADQAVLLVAHRSSTIRLADRIAVLAEGRIVEQGTHEELIQRGAHYRELITAQTAAVVGASPGALPRAGASGA